MKPAYNSYNHGERVWTCAYVGAAQELWEWRQSDTAPRFDVYSSPNNNACSGLAREDAVWFAGLLLKDPAIAQVTISVSTALKPGDWHLIETLAAQPVEVS